MSEKSHLHRNVSKNWYAAGIIIAILLCVSVFLLISYIKQLSPPDITDCTSIKIQYYPSFMSYYFLMSSYFIRNFVSFMSQEEEKYLHSFDTYSVNDKQKIQAFAKEVSLGSYFKKLWLGQKILMPSQYASVKCYKDNKIIISFIVFSNTIYIPDRSLIYNFPLGSPDMEIHKPKETLPLELRARCAINIWKLRSYRALYSVDNNSKSYVDPNRWCDIVEEKLQNLYEIHDGVKTRDYSDEQIYNFFSCPCVQKNNLSNKISEENDKPILTFISNYAMNSNCRPDSPKDMVLLFETKDGWNQHGGPELFTFDNHDPKGGCVLFNDGAIKFIRTEEELNKLRWK